VAWSATAPNHTGRRRPRVRAAAASPRPETHCHHPVTKPPPPGRRRSPPRTPTPRLNNNHPPPVSAFLLFSPLACSSRPPPAQIKKPCPVVPLGTIGDRLPFLSRTSDRTTTAAFGGLRALFGGSARGSGGVWLTARQRRRRSSWTGSS